MATIYDLLYDFLMQHIFTSSSLDNLATQLGSTVSFNEWLGHTTCVVIMVLFVVVLILGAVWLFKLVSGLILLKR